MLLEVMLMPYAIHLRQQLYHLTHIFLSTICFVSLPFSPGVYMHSNPGFGRGVLDEWPKKAAPFCICGVDPVDAKLHAASYAQFEGLSPCARTTLGWSYYQVRGFCTRGDDKLAAGGTIEDGELFYFGCINMHHLPSFLGSSGDHNQTRTYSTVDFTLRSLNVFHVYLATVS